MAAYKVETHKTFVLPDERTLSTETFAGRDFHGSVDFGQNRFCNSIVVDFVVI